MFQSAFSKFMSAVLSVLLFLSGSSMAEYDYSDRLKEEDYIGLKDVYAEYFDIGTCVGSFSTVVPELSEILLKNYSTLTGENAFKLACIHPSEDVWNFKPADMIADFARKNNLKLRGHTLVWGNDNWMLYDDDGNIVDKETFFKRQYEYFKVMIDRYGDVIRTWDVVNEPFNYKADKPFKETDIYKLCGEEYITRAFEMAHEIDPDAVLVLNETRVLKNSAKKSHILKYIEKYKKAGVPIHAIGLQSHYDVLNPVENARNLDRLINKISALGFDVQITEIDMTYYLTETYSYEEQPQWIQTLQIKKYKEVFEVLRKNADKISSVTFWGMSDSLTYYNAQYTHRTDWPMIFDFDYRPKQAYYAICDF